VVKRGEKCTDTIPKKYIFRSYNKSPSILCFFNAKRLKKMLKNFKFGTFIGRFQAKPWQWKGQEEGIGAESECSNDDDVLCSRSRWGGGCCWPSCPCRTLWWTCGDLWRAVRSTPSCLWGPRTRTWRSRYGSVFNAVPHWSIGCTYGCINDDHHPPLPKIQS